jgi:hypothetical protein
MRNRLCKLVLVFVLMAAVLTAFGLSFISAANVHEGAWHVLDYWRAWFCVVMFVAGCICTILLLPASADALDGICGGKE